MSIPIFTGKLNEAKESTDKANLRAAKAAAITYYLSNDGKGSTKIYYDVKEGTMTATLPVGYNKADQKGGADGKAELPEGTAVVKVVYTNAVDKDGKDVEGNVKAYWFKGATATE